MVIEPTSALIRIGNVYRLSAYRANYVLENVRRVRYEGVRKPMSIVSQFCKILFHKILVANRFTQMLSRSVLKNTVLNSIKLSIMGSTVFMHSWNSNMTNLFSISRKVFF